MNIEERIEQVESKEDFVNFTELLIEDLKNRSDEWRNKTLFDYLAAIASWTEDMEGYYVNNNLPFPKKVDWKIFANILMAAKVYE